MPSPSLDALRERFDLNTGSESDGGRAKVGERIEAVEVGSDILQHFVVGCVLTSSGRS